MKKLAWFLCAAILLTILAPSVSFSLANDPNLPYEIENIDHGCPSLRLMAHMRIWCV